MTDFPVPGSPVALACAFLAVLVGIAGAVLLLRHCSAPRSMHPTDQLYAELDAKARQNQQGHSEGTLQQAPPEATDGLANPTDKPQP